MLSWILIGATCLVAIALIIVVMMQDSKDGSSSAIGNTFYGSNKGNTLDGILSKVTIYLGIAFIILCFVTTYVMTIVK